MIEERHGDDVVQRLIDEIRTDIPVYDDFVYDEGLRFARRLYTDEFLAPQGDATYQWSLLYTAVTGFMGGYGTAVDGEWSESTTWIDRDVAQSTGWGKMGQALVTSLGRLPRPVTLPRTASFARAGMEMGLDDETQFYSSYGFARGLECGFEQLESGEAESRSDAGKRLVELAEALDRCVDTAVEDALADMRDSVRILVTQIMPAASPAMLAPECDDPGQGDPRNEAETASGATSEEIRKAEMESIRRASPEAFAALERAMRQATRAGVWAAVSGLSGANSCDEEAVMARSFSYAHHFLTGIIDFAFDCVDDAETLDFPASSEQYAIFDAPGHADDIIDMFGDIGRLYEDEVATAKLHMRMLYDCANEFANEVPDADDAFWTVAGVAYAHGIRHASEMGYEGDERAHAEFEEMLNQAAERDEEANRATAEAFEEMVFGGEGDPCEGFVTPDGEVCMVFDDESPDGEAPETEETLEMELASGDFFGDFVLSVVPNPSRTSLRSQFVLLAQAYGSTPEADVAAIGILASAAIVSEPPKEAKFEFFQYIDGLCQVKEGLADALRRHWYEIGAWRVLGNWFMSGIASS